MLPLEQRNSDHLTNLCYLQRTQNNIMNTKPPYYRIYLLTVWQEQNRGPPDLITWRFRLEDPRSGRQQVFADAAALMDALHKFATVSNDSELAKESE